jgi:D-xylose transport system substrate-binding protein
VFSILAIVLIGSGAYYYYKLFQKPAAIRNTTGRSVVIGFSLGTLQEERWQKDRDEFLKKAKSLGVSVDLQGANNDKQKQISQLEGMIVKKVDVLVIAPYDAASLTDVIDKAHKAGIKVISYDRLITGAAVDMYLSFDNEKVGALEAQAVVDSLKDSMGKGKKLKIAYIGGSTTDNNALLLKKGSLSVLQPYIDSGSIELVVDKFTPDWKPELAYQTMKAYMDKTNGAIDGVVCANDGTAFGAIRALQEYKLAGVVPVSGQDAELAALQRIVQGTQVSTVYKPIPKLAGAAVELAIQFVNGEKIQTNATIPSGVLQIPSVLLDPVAVTKDNIETTVIKDAYHTKEEIYKK